MLSPMSVVYMCCISIFHCITLETLANVTSNWKVLISCFLVFLLSFLKGSCWSRVHNLCVNVFNEALPFFSYLFSDLPCIFHLLPSPVLFLKHPGPHPDSYSLLGSLSFLALFSLPLLSKCLPSYSFFKSLWKDPLCKSSALACTTELQDAVTLSTLPQLQLTFVSISLPLGDSIKDLGVIRPII